MPKMTMTPAATTIEVPAGRYVARFTGTEDRKPFEDSKYGSAGSPRMGWLFEVAEGPMRGKKISQESGCAAVPRSTAARMLTGLVGRPVAMGETVDLDALVGRVYSLKVAVNPDSDKGNLHVADLEPHLASAPAGAASAAAPPPRSAGAPGGPRRTPPPAGNYMYWFALSDAAEPEQISHKDLQDYILTHHLDPAAVECCRVGDAEYKPANAYGFVGATPY